MTDSFEDRLLGMIQHSVKVEILETDHTSVLFLVTIKDRYGTRRHKGIFYPKEWRLGLTDKGWQHDDFELECEEYTTQEEDDYKYRMEESQKRLGRDK